MKLFFFIFLLSLAVFSQPFRSPLILTDDSDVEVSRWFFSPCISNPLLHSLNFGRNINTGNTGCNNLIVGNYEAEASLITGLNNTVIGNSAAVNLTSGTVNLCGGQSACGGLTTGSYNIMFGQATGAWNPFAQRVINIGHRAGSQQSFFGEFTADDNVNIGYESAYQNQGGFRNTFIGNNSGRSSGSFDSVFVGYNAGRFEAGDNKFIVANFNNELLNGTFSADVNSQFLTVKGNLVLTETPKTTSCVKGTLIFNSWHLFICVTGRNGVTVWKSIDLNN